MPTISTVGEPEVGIAFSASTPGFLARHPDAIDYVEVPFELLCHNPSAGDVAAVKPIVLHCASLSIAGMIPPSRSTVNMVKEWIIRTETPWLGEHLSFITADRQLTGEPAEESAPGEPWNIGYTVSPPLNEQSVVTVLRSLSRVESELTVPVLVENAPIYFIMPGSTMTQTEFINEICARSEVRLLLDLAHFYISAQALNYDPRQELLRLPLDRVVEVHMSGVDTEAGGRWDNHAARAPQIEFDLLADVLQSAPVRAITLEYNWSARFPENVLLQEIHKTRQVLERAKAP
jgi:uncharacterized protein